MTNSPKIFIVQGEHFSNPGRTMSAWSTHLAASDEAASLVNIMLDDAGLAADATAFTFEERLLALRKGRAEEAGIDWEQRTYEDDGEEIADFMGDDDCDVWITEVELGGPIVVPPFIAAVIRDASGAISDLSEQVSQMSGMFDDADGAIEKAQDNGQETLDAIASALASMASNRPVPVHIGLVNHRHGTNAYTATTKAGVVAKVAGFCLDNAAIEKVEITDAMAHETIIETYFNQVEDEDVAFTEDSL